MRKLTRSVENPAELFTVAEIAKFDSCSERTIRRAIAAGLLAAIRIGPGGRLLRVSREAHEAYRRAGSI